MAVLKILYLPDERLRKMSTPIENINDEIQTVIDDMFETMYEARGVGLAAPQVGVNLRLSVVDCSADKSGQKVYINPVITASQGQEKFKEGCLSVPGALETVVRAQKVTVTALDRHGNSFTEELEGLDAECIQHEIDHLDGKLFIDLLSPIKKHRARKDLEKFLREQQHQK